MPVTAQASIASHSLLGLAQAAKQVFWTHISATVDFSGGEERQALHSESRSVISRVVCLLEVGGWWLLLPADCWEVLGLRCEGKRFRSSHASNCRELQACGKMRFALTCVGKAAATDAGEEVNGILEKRVV